MEKSEMTYAGFWRRFAAYMLDGVIIGFFMNSVYWFVRNQIQLSGGRFDVTESMTNVIFSLLSTIFCWCYFSGLESSPLQATLGKWMVGIYVTDMEGNRIGFGKATGRFFSKIISGIILTVGYWLAGFTEKKQALHDMIAGCLVLRK
ncbi:RDD family protein [candidate division KSB1 bacterium]|nr:RDD family protein [candidate division KSB1 bacterium]